MENNNKKIWDNIEIIKTPLKKAIYIKLDEEILQYLQSQGKGYQTKINEILRSYVEYEKKKLNQ